jgi:hypothetical protein
VSVPVAERPWPDPEYRIGWAAMMLAGDLAVCEALQRGLPVPRWRLNWRVLKAIGEPLRGAPLVLSEELALRVETGRPPGGYDLSERSRR